MEKLVYLMWGEAGHPPSEIRDLLLQEISPRLLGAGARSLNVSVADLQEEIPKPMLLMGEGATLSAAISLWMDNIDDRGPLEHALGAAAARLDGYLVTESIPEPCLDRDWPDGTRSPGLTHFTWFPKPERLSDEEFFHGWHQVHSPFSFDLHPLRWQYVRNSVARTLTAGSPPIRAIVAERFRTLEDYTDPERLFGSRELLMRSGEELSSYADIDQIHSVPLSEYIVKS
jgi:hypothetical protein